MVDLAACLAWQMTINMYINSILTSQATSYNTGLLNFEYMANI